MKRWRYILSGRVQGVGLRYRAYIIAKELKLTGFIENRYDGTVKLEVQGESKTVDRFIENVKELKYVRVDSLSKEEIPLKHERSFNMKY